MTKQELEAALGKRRDELARKYWDEPKPYVPKECDFSRQSRDFNAGHDSLKPLLVEAISVIEKYQSLTADHKQIGGVHFITVREAGLPLIFTGTFDIGANARAFLEKLQKELEVTKYPQNATKENSSNEKAGE